MNCQYTMKNQRYNANISVLAIPQDPRLFFMNMKAYAHDNPEDIVLDDMNYQTKLIGNPDEPTAEVWCAVHDFRE